MTACFDTKEGPWKERRQEADDDDESVSLGGARCGFGDYIQVCGKSTLEPSSGCVSARTAIGMLCCTAGLRR
jgi:hypothetical protein